MGTTIELTAADGHRLQAYRADPDGGGKGSVVLIQEVFGVTPHLTSIADDYAAAGFTVIAPALFDRVAPGTHFQPTEEDRQIAAAFYKQLTWEETILDVGAAFAAASELGKAGILGFCLGGDSPGPVPAPTNSMPPFVTMAGASPRCWSKPTPAR